ncbi:hypothetical protein ABZX75_14465 [Streptomyces sp. NPDC003038]|uniref:hypothetical protein n=1 Tax=unclassified Streptomyces TaxID=2593676 RepID=UPI0033B77E89
MDLHPCECGSSDFERRHHLEQHGGDIAAVYEGACGQCGRDRVFTFVMAEEIPPPPPAFGGPEPSQIIDPGEFSEVANRIARRSGLAMLNSPPSEHHKHRGATAYALAAVEEVLKFLPPGQDAIPASAFTSEVGKARYAKDPGKFRRDILEIELRLTRKILANIDRVSTPPPGTNPPA